ncbi:MAG TPA: YceI family protein [Gammaproteobacteria bacterium]|nr:YceI family protein [Gammaproteobacteria bacterium]
MFKNFIFIGIFILTTGLLGCQKSPEEMTLDPNQSVISFTSIKKGNIAETHTFKTISGTFASDGLLKVDIQLASVETHIPVRNERMKTLLFEVSKFSTAELTASVNNDFPEGKIRQVSVKAHLNLHGKTVPLTIDAQVARVGGELIVGSLKPVILQVADFGLSEGVDRLMQAAKLPSIARTVPVTFNLVFKP